MEFKKLFFSSKGRLNRQRYIFAALGVGFAQIVIQLILMSVIFAAEGGGAKLVFLPFFIFIVAIIWSYCVLAIKRLHDINKSGCYLLWSLVPIAGPILMLYWTLIEKGTAGDNEYGADLLSSYAENTSAQALAMDCVDRVSNTPSVQVGSLWSRIPLFVKVIGIFSAIISVILVILISVASMVKSSEAYSTSIGYISNDPQTLRMVGEIESFGYLPSGSVSLVNGYGQALFSIDVYGSKANINANIRLDKVQYESWQVIQYVPREVQ